MLQSVRIMPKDLGRIHVLFRPLPRIMMTDATIHCLVCWYRRRIHYRRRDRVLVEKCWKLTLRLEELEKIAHSFNGVDKCFAIQAGREIRILVENEKISDNDAVMLCKDIIKKIESELTYPGQIKVTVIRETRISDYAK